MDEKKNICGLCKNLAICVECPDFERFEYEARVYGCAEFKYKKGL